MDIFFLFKIVYSANFKKKNLKKNLLSFNYIRTIPPKYRHPLHLWD